MNNQFKSILRDIDTLVCEKQTNLKLARALALITTIVAIIPICGFINYPIETLYFAILFINLFVLISKRDIKFNRAFIFFYIVLIFNVCIVDIPVYFKPVFRLGLFVLVTITSSSVIQNNWAISFRNYILKYIVIGLSLLSIGSFFCYFLGVNMMAKRNLNMADFEVYSNNGGWFGGLLNHSIMLGAISMIVSVLFFMLYVEKKKGIYIILFLCSMGSALFSSSRSAVLGITITILYSLIFGIFRSEMKKKIIGLLIFCGAISFLTSDIAFKGLIDKQQNRMEKSEGLNSRQDKFDYRIAEFKKAPLLGVGFCAIDVNVGDRYNSFTGQIEPGTSHLAVLSMTGLLGMAAYLMILFQAYSNARKTHTPHSKFVLLCFIALFVHAWFEGYVFSAGGFLAFLYWLIIGQCIDCETVLRRRSIAH